ncbi:conjugal transfer protein TraD [Candidatus Methylospira mobilis]|uniref:conjugal transfer protein TraD n=1 Tax=Candidatus Methylospira mobilis TaxID=1808979 RepID=UPI0028E53ADE|nr:conjugal transfer protein TraD [Candidatus Methylospira mobilis]WNV03393.1 conjugal transfer protein TraD [Candidatus Methylospira mobilis]
MIELGGLVDLAGLSERDKGELLGALLGLSRVLEPERWAKWKQEGDALLTEREQEKMNASRPSQPD